MNGEQSYDNYPDPAPTSNSGVYESAEKDFLKELIDVEDVLDSFEHRVLRGEILKIDEESGKKEWTPMPEGHQMINETGVRELMSRIIGKVSKIARLTYKTDEEIMKDMFFFDMSITELVAKRCDSWGINVEVAKSLKDAAVELVWDISASSRDGFFAINLRSSYSRSDVSRVDSQGGGSSAKRTFMGIPLPSRK